MNLIEYPDRDFLMLGLADRIAGELAETLRLSGRASLSVPGGTTPGPVFDLLSAVDLDWSQVAVILNDERWVDDTSERSNTRLLRKRLLRGRAAAAQLVPLYAAAETPEAQLAALSEGVAPHLPLSVLLLGMGADMHTASLFPGAPELDAALAPDAPPVLQITAPGQPEPRITLTAPVLRGALSTHILITGAEKRAALKHAAELGDPHRAPISLALKGATVHWTQEQ